MQVSKVCLAFLVLTVFAGTLHVYANDAAGAIVQDAAKLKELKVTDDALFFSGIHYTRPFVECLISIMVYGALLGTGRAARLQKTVERLTSNTLIQVVIYYGAVATLVFLVFLPCLFFYSHLVADHYHLSNMTSLEWFFERIKRFGVNTAVGITYWGIFFFILRRFRRQWHLVLFAILAPLSAFMVFVWPVAVDPLFNKFSPLENGDLRTKIELLASKAGIPGATILVADKSKQTKQLNAYVTGIGSSARIVLWDTILAKMPQDELLTVVGHEIGHYVLLHIYKGYAMAMLGLLTGLLLAGRGAPVLLRKLPASWGVYSLNSLTLIPLIGLMSAPTTLLFAPLESSISRSFEHESDVFALSVTQAPTSLANAFITLAQEDLINPSPPEWIEFWFFSHPSLSKRISFAMSHRAK
ncbi:MAG: M48 family metallopeptidase [Candidatus Obscuribacterales bacterium]|nr:M48 family metallopeptidase [Candidatus Obscuribacterales bacterium]